MPLEEEMKHEMYKLDKEITLIDEEIQKLYTKIANLINIRKKKEHEVKVLKENFGLYDEISDREIQTNLSRLLREA